MTHLNELKKISRIVPFVFEGKKVPMAITNALFVETLPRYQNCYFRAGKAYPQPRVRKDVNRSMRPIDTGTAESETVPIITNTICVAIQV
jgi:hypothetical protein